MRAKEKLEQKLGKKLTWEEFDAWYKKHYFLRMFL